jgi:hypothetical protein
VQPLRRGAFQEPPAVAQKLPQRPHWLPTVQTIEAADLISNLRTVEARDPHFAAIYMHEKRLLLDVLTRANERLRSDVRNHRRLLYAARLRRTDLMDCCPRVGGVPAR